MARRAAPNDKRASSDKKNERCVASRAALSMARGASRATLGAWPLEFVAPHVVSDVSGAQRGVVRAADLRLLQRRTASGAWRVAPGLSRASRARAQRAARGATRIVRNVKLGVVARGSRRGVVFGATRARGGACRLARDNSRAARNVKRGGRRAARDARRAELDARRVTSDAWRAT